MDASLSVFLLLPAFCSSDADFLLFFGALPFSDIERLPETFFRSGRTLTPSDSSERYGGLLRIRFSLFRFSVRMSALLFSVILAFVCSFCLAALFPLFFDSQFQTW